MIGKPLLSILLFALPVLAADITVDGVTYSNVSVISNRCDLYGIVIMHKAGITRVEYKDMSEADKLRYGYNEGLQKKAEQKKAVLNRGEGRGRRGSPAPDLSPEDVQARAEQAKQKAEVESKEAQAKQEAERKTEEIERKKWIRIVDGIAYDFGEIITEFHRVVKAGTKDITHDPNISQAFESQLAQEDAFVKRYGAYIVEGKVIQVLDDGLLVDCADSLMSGYNDLIMVKDYKKESVVVDGDSVVTAGMPVGRYQYVAVTGAKKTIVLFASAQKPDKDIPLSEAKRLSFDK